MANPRKFSEKIALHTQKQAEETAAFEAILKEVSTTTRQAPKQPGQPSQLQHLAQPTIGAYRGRSLPNVNQISSGSVDLQSALSSLENMRQSLNGQPPPEKTTRIRTQQTQKKFTLDRHRDCSPYGSVYLSPPDTSWRRASSDSALHASVQASAPGSGLSGSSSQLMNGQGGMAILSSGQPVPMDTGQYWLNSKDGRPRSCEVPGISIFPSPDQGSAASHVPISNNTGSLPDLANLSFPSPLSTPLDVDTQNELQEQQQQQHHLQQTMRNVLPCYFTPVSMAIQHGQHRPGTEISMVMDGTRQQQQQMISVPPVIVQGSNHLLLSGRGVGSGGNAIFAQGSHFITSLPGLSPDLPTPPPPPYPSSASQVMSPPPMITITDETLNGNNGQILFTDFEQCLPKHCSALSYFSFGNDTACTVTSQPADNWQNFIRSSPANMPTSLPYQSWSSNALDSAPSKKLPQLSQSTSPSQGTDSFKGTSKPLPHNIMPSHSSVTNLPANDASKTEQQKAMPLVQPINQYPVGTADCHLVSPLSSQLHYSSCSPSQAAGISSASVAPSAVNQHLPDVIYHQELVAGGPTVIYNGSQSFNPVLFNLPQVSRPPQKESNSSQQPQQNLILQQNCQQFGTVSQKPVSGTVGMYGIPTVQQQQQPVVLPTGNLVLMQTTTTNSVPSIAGQPMQQSNQLLYQQALLQSLNSQWNSNQQLPHPATSAQIPVSQQEPWQPIQYMTTKQPTSSAVPDLVLTAEDLLLYGNQFSDVKTMTANTTNNGSDPLRGSLINASTYLGDSFDAADMFTAEEFLSLGLDPLELDEIQMLSDTAVVTDPATEDSFRLDRI